MQFRTQSFPSCIAPDSTVGDGTIHPVSVPLDKLAEWYWRVKKWELVADTSSGVKTFSDMEFEPANFVGATERDLICPVLGGEREIEDHLFIEWWIWFYSVQVNSAGKPGANPGNVTTDIGRQSAGLYYPQFLFICTSDGGGDLSSWNGGGGYSLASLPITVDGYDVPLYTTDETPFISLDFYPTEWWPYAPESDPGSPVWDSATGARLLPATVSD